MKEHYLKLLSILIVFIIGSCQENDELPKTDDKVDPPNIIENSIRGYEKTTSTDTVKMKQEVIYVKEDIESAFVDLDKESGRLTYSNAEATKQIKVGDVLYSTGSKEYPNGYALKVVELQEKDGKTVCIFEQAGMEDIFTAYHERVEYKPDVNEIQVYDIDKYIESAGLGEDNDNVASFTRSSFLQTGDKRIKLKHEGDKTILTYIAFDKDGNYSTKTDQLTIEVELKHESRYSDFTYDPGNLHFNAIGQMNFEAKFGLKWGVYNEETKDDIKTWIHKHNKELDKELHEKFNNINNLPLISIPLLPVGPVNLVVKPTIDVFLVFEMDINGQLKISTQVKPIVLNYDFTVNPYRFVQKVNFDKYQKPKITEVTGEATATIDSRLGIGTGAVFYFPAFDFKDSKGKTKHSKLGVYIDITLDGKIKASGNYEFYGSEDGFFNGNRWAKVDITGGVFAKPYVEGEVKLFAKEKKSIKFGWEPEQPIPVVDNELMHYSFGWYWLNPNKRKSITLPFIADNIMLSSSNPGVASATVSDDKMSITAHSAGKATIEYNNPDEWFRKTLLDIYVKESNLPPVPTDGLVAYYPFDGSANDESGNENNGTVHGAELAEDRHGNSNGAYYFGGISRPNHIHVRNSESLKFEKEATISLFVRTANWRGMDGWSATVAHGGHSLFAKSHDVRGFALMTSGNDEKLNTYMASYEGWIKNKSIGGELEGNYLNEWVHYAYVLSAESVKIYLNGELVKKVDTKPNFSTANNQDIYFGKFSDIWYPFHGYLDDIRIYNRALSDDEILSLSHE